MKKTVTVKLQIDSEIYEAAIIFLNQKGESMEQKLSKYIESLYTKNVPKSVRQYIESGTKKAKNLTKETSPGIDENIENSADLEQ